MSKTALQRIAPFTLALLTIAVAGSASAANIVQDGGFETPVVGPGGFQTGFQTFGVGSSFGSGNVWTVIGSNTGNVAVYPNTETIGSPPTALNVQEGKQALDLTGGTDNGSVTGVRQSITTTPGQSYNLSFYVGDLNNQTASVIVDLNGSLFKTATNSSPTTGFTTVWQNFSYSFTATSGTTTLAFINNVPGGVALNGLDAIDVEAAAAPTAPEPSSILLLGMGIAFLLLAGLRRSGDRSEETFSS